MKAFMVTITAWELTAGISSPGMSSPLFVDKQIVRSEVEEASASSNPEGVPPRWYLLWGGTRKLLVATSSCWYLLWGGSP